MKRTGKCLCGNVSYVATIPKPAITICHCGVCRRWGGGPFVTVAAASVDWRGEEHLQTFTSSAWAERAFCASCGTHLFYRLTAGKYAGHTALLLGTLDDPTGMSLEREWFIDRKPDCYALAGDHEVTTEAEAMAMFGAS